MKNSSVLWNALAQFLGKAGTVIASFLVVKIVSGFGTEFYGSYVTTYEFLAFFGVIADAGLFAVAVRDIAKLKSTKDPKAQHIIGNILSMRLALILAATLLAGMAAQLVPSYSPMIKAGIWITGLSMALTIVAGTLSAILQVRMKIHYFSSSLVAGKVFLALLIFWIAETYSAALTAEAIFFKFLWAGVASNLLFLSLVYFFARKEISFQLKFDKDYWKKTFKKSLPYGLALILQTLYLRADLILISLLLSTSSVGLYGVSARILESFLILGVFFGQAILPKFSQDEKNAKKLDQTLAWGAEKLLIFSLPIVGGCLLFAPEIVEFLSSKTYLSNAEQWGSDKALRWLIPTVFFAFFNQLFIFALIAKEKQNYLLGVNAIALSLNILLNLLFLPVYGIMAAAASTVFCEALVMALLLKQVWKYFSLQLNLQNIGIILGLNLFILSTIFYTPLAENLGLSILFGGTVYLGGLWHFRERFL